MPNFILGTVSVLIFTQWANNEGKGTNFTLLASFQAHSIEIGILLALVMFSYRTISNKLWVMQVPIDNYH